MTRTMIILQAIITVFMPAHRHGVSRKHNQPIKMTRVCLERDAEELEQVARERSRRSTCFLMATAERILLGHGSEQMKGHGKHKTRIG